MVPEGPSASCAVGKAIDAPCKVMPEVSVVLETTGRRQEKSTGVTGRSAGEVGVAPGAALIEDDRIAPGLTLAVEPDELQAASTMATNTTSRLIVGLNGSADEVLRRRFRGRLSVFICPDLAVTPPPAPPPAHPVRHHPPPPLSSLVGRGAPLAGVLEGLGGGRGELGVPASGQWPGAAGSGPAGGGGCGGSNRWRPRPPTASSSNAHASGGRSSWRTRTPRRRSTGCVRGSIACRWRSSSPPPALARCPRPRALPLPPLTSPPSLPLPPPTSPPLSRS